MLTEEGSGSSYLQQSFPIKQYLALSSFRWPFDKYLRRLAIFYNLEGSATLVAQLLAMTHPYRQNNVFAHLLKYRRHTCMRIYTSADTLNN